MAYKLSDQRLLEESVQLTLLKESAPNMTLSQVRANIELMTESEAEYINTVAERILQEFFGGAGNVFKGAKQLASGAMAGAKQKIGSAVSGAKDSIVQGAKDVGAGIGAASKQFGQNVKDLYQAGEQESQYGQWKDKAKESVDELVNMLQDAQSKGLIDYKGDVTRINLKTIVDKLLSAYGSAKSASEQQRNQGLMKGVGSAYKNRSVSQPAPQQQQQPGQYNSNDQYWKS